MPIYLASLEPAPERAEHVRRAIEQMIEESRDTDPMLGRYELYESLDRPGVLVVQQEVSAVDDRLEARRDERLMELGTALREELRAPMQIERLRPVAAATST